MSQSRRRPCLILFVLLTACRSTDSADPELRAALVARATKDQREMLDQAAHATDSVYRRQVTATLRSNAEWLDSIVAAKSWPGFARVDSIGAHDAFLIAQHSDSSPVRQRRFLTALRAAVAAHDALPQDLAYLEDRVRKADARPQLYGTQPAYDSIGTAIQPIVEAPDSLDTRRARVGLMPMAKYLEQMRATNAALRAMQSAAMKPHSNQH